MQSLIHQAPIPVRPLTSPNSSRISHAGLYVPKHSRLQRMVVRAAGGQETPLGSSWCFPDSDEEAAFERKLTKLKTAKGAMPWGESRKDKGGEPKKKFYDYSDEVVFFEGSPSAGDLAVNVLLGITLIWLPLTAAAVGRFAFVKYRVTDKRMTVTTKAPWQDEELEVAYQEVANVVAIGRGIGAWGDMVVTLKNGTKVEVRSLERWQEIKDYILERKAALTEVEAPSTGFL